MRKQLTANTSTRRNGKCVSPVVSAGHRVELGDVVHHGGLQRYLLHEHRGGGDVLDLSLQEHFIRLDAEKPEITNSGYLIT